jgi:hypothetical protein
MTRRIVARATAPPRLPARARIKTLFEGGEAKVDLPHHIMSVFGRQLSIVEGNGNRVGVALFAYHARLCQFEGKSLRVGNDATADAIRFVQSLIFTGRASNPSADEIRAVQSACRGSHGPSDGGVPGSAVPDDGHRFEVECRRQRSFVALVISLNTGTCPVRSKPIRC